MEWRALHRSEFDCAREEEGAHRANDDEEDLHGAQNTQWASLSV